MCDALRRDAGPNAAAAVMMLAAFLFLTPLAARGQEEDPFATTLPAGQTAATAPAAAPAKAPKTRAASAPAGGGAAVSAAGNLSARDLYAKCSPAVGRVEVFTRSGERIGSGSGFLVSGNGLLVTNYHVVAEAASARVYFSDTDKRNVVGLVASDPKADLAVLRVEGKVTTYLELAKALPDVGSKVYAISSPIGLTNTLSDGLVSGIRDRNGVKDIQTTTPMTHGSSGGPLLSEDARVVGVTWGGHDSGGNIGFAIGASYLKNLLERVVAPKPLPGAGGRTVAPPRDDPAAAAGEGPGSGKTYLGIESIIREMPAELFPNRKVSGDLARALVAQRDQWMLAHLPGCRLRIENGRWMKGQLLSSTLLIQMVNGVQVGSRRWVAEIRAIRRGAMEPKELPLTTAILERKPNSWTSIEGRLAGLDILETEIHVALVDWESPAGPRKPAPSAVATKPAPRPATRPAPAKTEERTPEQRAASLLQLADNYVQSGLSDKAAATYRKIIEDFPRTKAAAQASECLEKLGTK